MSGPLQAALHTQAAPPLARWLRSWTQPAARLPAAAGRRWLRAQARATAVLAAARMFLTLLGAV